MKFQRIVRTELTDGLIVFLYPFHLSLEGMESTILCRDDEDYDVLVKYIALSAKCKNVIIVVYAVVSNHAHCVVLANSESSARAFGNELKRRYSMWLNRKYSEDKVLHRRSLDVQYLDSDWYLRNAIAYDIRNALDNGAENISQYRWTSYRSLFCGGSLPPLCLAVSSLTTREAEKALHSGVAPRESRWFLNASYEIEPASFCYWQYAEAAFGHDQAFFLKCLGGVNTSEMSEKLIVAHKLFKTDSELYKSINDISQKWYQRDISSISSSQKSRLVPYIYHTVRTSVPQLARCFSLSREHIASLLGTD